MANELDDYLNQQQQQKQKQAAEQVAKQQAEENEIKAFNNAFKDLRDTLIYPTMIGLLDNLRKHGTSAHVHDIKMKGGYHHQSYYIAKGNEHGIISVLGNYHKRKVCVDTEYFEYVQKDQSNKSIKKTQEQYDLAEITPAMLETCLLNAIKQLAADNSK